jgi:hypothetical protein
MNRNIGLALLASSLLFTAGCSTNQVSPTVIDTSSARFESLNSWSRPVELAVDVLQETEGEAYTEKIFWWTIEGDSPRVSFLSWVFAGDGQEITSLGRVAAARAIDRTPEADGLYITRIENDSKNYFIYRKERVKVTGRALKINDLGTVSQDRADKVRESRAAVGAGGVTSSGGGGLFSWMWN